MQRKARMMTVIPGVCVSLIVLLVVVSQARGPVKLSDPMLGLAVGALLGIALVSLVKSKLNGRRAEAGVAGDSN